MSSTLGMPSATPSNATGRSGVGEDQVGHIGKGILGTVEEGAAATSSRQFYYGTGSAFFQAPSTQRSYGDDIRSFNVKQYGARGMVNLPRRWFDCGPTELFFSYPIEYAWAGPEYSLRTLPKTQLQMPIKVNTGYTTDGSTSTAEITSAVYGNYLGDVATEVRSGPNILPTYFWSGGVGFAFLAMIELNMGGGGNIIFDRYTNFAMIMASCPTIQMRADLMKMAGGGLYYDYDTDYTTLPVKFGYVPCLTDEGTAVNRNGANSASNENGDNMNGLWAPIEWQIHVPLKTPQTNFWHSLLARKPVDSSCVASDMQFIITLGNFYEFSDTGTGLAHCPYYIPLLGMAASPATVAADVIQTVPYYHPNQKSVSGSASATVSGGAGTWSYTSCLQDRWYVRTAGSTSPNIVTGTVTTGTLNQWPEPALLPPGWFYTGFSPQLDINLGATIAGASNVLADTLPNIIKNTAVTPAAGLTYRSVVPRHRVAATPRIWANHYRVCNGFIYGGYGKPRPRMAVSGTITQSDARYKYEVKSVANGSPTPISYASSFIRMEYRNHSLKLTNPNLSASLALKSTAQACVYYPFSYGFSQTYRIPPSSNPWDANNFHRWNSAMTVITNTSLSQSVLNCFVDSQAVSNRITQNIIMPANMCTSMIVGIYREKDRKFLGMNTQGSYSPVLFWNALNPVRCTLYDGGNILFDYTANQSFEFGSMVDRPDVFRIPFRGGLCQLDPKNILPPNQTHGMSGNSLFDAPNMFAGVSGVPSRFIVSPFTGNAERNIPIHCTEWYNCHLLEFPFAMHEPLGREGIVQSTPSFAKTILRLEFYIDALLKPPRGLDDMYDQTTVMPTLWFCGEWDYGATGTINQSYTSGTSTGTAYGPLSFANTTKAVENVKLSVPCAYILDSCMNPNAYADLRENTIQSSRTSNKVTNPYFTMSPSASSWNVNDGGLMVQVNFIQNQVWVLSPLRTTILSSRG